MEGIRFGANYMPRKNWFYTWADWDETSVSEDLAAIASLGLDHIRAHCMWPLFQYGEDRFSEAAFSHLNRLLELSAQYGLDVVVTALNGFMSGCQFIPFFAHKQHNQEENFFTDAHMLRAEKRYFERLYEICAPHANFLGFDLGNELNCNGDFGMALSPAILDAWSETMFAHLRQLCPNKLLCSGVDHIPYFTNEAFSRTSHANSGNVTAIHTWLGFTGALARFGYDTQAAYALPEYMVELARAYQEKPHPIWVQEFGESRDWMPESAIPAFMQGTIERLCRCEDVWGATWWCSHDVDPRFSELNHMEFSLGLFDSSNRPKPEATALAEAIRQARQTRAKLPARTVALIADECLFDGSAPPDAPQDYPGWALGTAFMRLLSRGISPAIVTRSAASDAAYLARRGITQLVTINDV